MHFEQRLPSPACRRGARGPLPAACAAAVSGATVHR